MIRKTKAVQWVCDACHDTGYERTTADALDALDQHTEDYHE